MASWRRNLDDDEDDNDDDWQHLYNQSGPRPDGIINMGIVPKSFYQNNPHMNVLTPKFIHDIRATLSTSLTNLYSYNEDEAKMALEAERVLYTDFHERLREIHGDRTKWIDIPHEYCHGIIINPLNREYDDDLNIPAHVRTRFYVPAGNHSATEYYQPGPNVSYKDIDPKVLYVRNFHSHFTVKDLCSLFPRLYKLMVSTYGDTTRMRHAFIRFGDVQDAIGSMQDAYLKQIYGKPLFVTFRRIPHTVSAKQMGMRFKLIDNAMMMMPNPSDPFRTNDVDDGFHPAIHRRLPYNQHQNDEEIRKHSVLRLSWNCADQDVAYFNHGLRPLRLRPSDLLSMDDPWMPMRGIHRTVHINEFTVPNSYEITFNTATRLGQEPIYYYYQHHHNM